MINNDIKNYLLEALAKGEIDLKGMNAQTADIITQLLGEISVKQARRDFYTFVKLMADELIPTGFIDGRHIKLICRELQEVEQSIVDVYEGRQKLTTRKQFFLPPGAMKSLLISVLFVSWFLGRHPKWRVLQIGYSTDFAIDNFGRKVKDIINSNEKFKMIFPDAQLKSDTRSAQRFELTRGGGYFCTGATSGIAGRRAHLLICDDVITEQTAYSDAERTKIVRWYIPGARSRLLPNSAEVIVNTRWHVDDLSAHLVKVDNVGKNPWKIISIPALMDAEALKLLNFPQAELGKTYWPEFYPTDYFVNIRDSYLASGEAARWSALYLQNPVPEEGNIIKRDYITYWKKKEAPKCDFVIVSVDTAYETTKRADFTAVTVWGVFKTSQENPNTKQMYIQNNVILLDAMRGKYELPELIELLEEVVKDNKPDYVLVEKKSSGISVIQELRRKPHIPLYEIIPDRDKMSRLQACIPTFKAGCVWLPDPVMLQEQNEYDYTAEFLTELLQFPASKHDDYVDTCSMLINWMRLNLVLSRPGEIGFEDEDMEEEKNRAFRKPNTYWASLQR